MELLEYIKKNYKTPNVAVLRTLGASEELIEYLTNTPWNTNMKVVESLISGGGEGSESTEGIMSISISPEITLEPVPGDAGFPIYIDRIKEMGDNSFTGFISDGIVVGSTYTITLTPTKNVALTYEGGPWGGNGEPLVINAKAISIEDGKNKSITIIDYDIVLVYKDVEYITAIGINETPI